MVGAGSPDGRQRRHAGAARPDGEPGSEHRCARAAAAAATAAAAPPPAAYGAGLAHSKVHTDTHVVKQHSCCRPDRLSLCNVICGKEMPLHAV